MRLRPVCDSVEHGMRTRLLRHANGRADCGKTSGLNSRICCLSCPALCLPVRASQIGNETAGQDRQGMTNVRRIDV